MQKTTDLEVSGEFWAQERSELRNYFFASGSPVRLRD